LIAQNSKERPGRDAVLCFAHCRINPTPWSVDQLKLPFLTMWLSTHSYSLLFSNHQLVLPTIEGPVASDYTLIPSKEMATHQEEEEFQRLGLDVLSTRLQNQGYPQTGGPQLEAGRDGSSQRGWLSNISPKPLKFLFFLMGVAISLLGMMYNLDATGPQ